MQRPQEDRANVLAQILARVLGRSPKCVVFGFPQTYTQDV